MPTGPKGEKRPADVTGNAVKVMRIAAGEIEEDAVAPSFRGAKRRKPSSDSGRMPSFDPVFLACPGDPVAADHTEGYPIIRICSNLKLDRIRA
jgi:hypothetical protein